MIAAPKYGSLWKSQGREDFVCRTRFPWREAVATREERGRCTWGTRRGRGPSTSTRMAEIMSGRAHSQQGLVTTCKDSWHKGKPRRGEGVGLAHEPVGAKKEEEGLPRGLWKSSRSGGNLRPGKGALGTRWFQIGPVRPDTELGYRRRLLGTRIRANQGSCGVGPAGLNPHPPGKTGIRPMACRAETRTGLGKSDRPGS